MTSARDVTHDALARVAAASGDVIAQLRVHNQCDCLDVAAACVVASPAAFFALSAGLGDLCH